MGENTRMLNRNFPAAIIFALAITAGCGHSETKGRAAADDNNENSKLKDSSKVTNDSTRLMQDSAYHQGRRDSTHRDSTR